MVGRSVKPRRGLIGVLINAVSGEIHEADVQLSLRVAPARSNKKLPGILLRDGRLQGHRLGLDVRSAREHHDRSNSQKANGRVTKRIANHPVPSIGRSVCCIDHAGSASCEIDDLPAHGRHAIEELFEQENPRFSVLPVRFLVGIVPAIVVATGNRLHDDAIPPRHHIQVLV